MKKCIFIFRHYATPPHIPGGRRIFNVARLMANNGHHPFVFVSNFSHFIKQYIKKFSYLYKNEQVQAVQFVWINNKPAYQKNDWRRLLGMLDYSLKAYIAGYQLTCKNIKPDLIIGSVAHIFAAFSAYLLSLKLKKRFWLDVGDVWPEAYIKSGVLTEKHPLSLMMAILSSFLYRRAEKIIVLTESTKKHLLALGIPKEKILLFSNGILFDEIKINEPVVSNDAIFKITYAGSFGELYPLEELIKAAYILKNRDIDIKLDIVGGGLKKTKLIKLARGLSLDRVHIYGPVARDELQNIYTLSDALVLVEKDVSYGFPNKVIDYSIAGKPIILASESNYNLPDDLYLKVKPKAEQIAAAIVNIIEMKKNSRFDTGKAIQDYAIMHFDMQKKYKKIINPLI